jgi:hypothetical protein
MEPKEVELSRLFQTKRRTMISPYDKELEHGPGDFCQVIFARDPLLTHRFLHGTL